ncbi:MAG: drug/metabolite exporter YedA [Candidatus Methylopumilus sp.]
MNNISGAGLVQSRKLLIVMSLLALYIIWGSTYLAMVFAMDSLPPFMMAALRFGMAGLILYAWLRWRGQSAPSLKQWLGAAAVGTLLLAVGNAGVAYAEKTVSSGVAALGIATVPIWMALFSGWWGHWPTRREWLGIAIGTIGVAVLSTGGAMQASPLGAALIMLSAASWAFGSVWGKRLPMAAGSMASASQMLAGGGVLVVVSLIMGEPWPQQLSAKTLYAMLYLVIFGSLIAYSAYLFLLHNVRPALATSNTFVNPMVALLLGAWLADEVIGPAEYMALAIIVVGVLLVLPFERNK